MNIIEAYNTSVAEDGFTEDPAQRNIIERMQRLQRELIDASRQSLFERMIDHFKLRDRNIEGIYLWGDVGRGKTRLMKLFIDTLQGIPVKRMHFHHFMITIHEQLSSMPHQKNPLDELAKSFAKKYKVLCLDEFIVTNITDAMLLDGLLDALFRNGITLVATSNRIPDDLYLNGLQRERFLPAIDMIKRRTDVLELEGETDHRLALLEQEDIYLSPVDDNSEARLHEHMSRLAGPQTENGITLQINRRSITTRRLADDVVWFDFEAICDAPRATPDYIDIAERFHTVIISRVPVMDEYQDDRARRFIYLIDELYDRNVKLIMSAEATEQELYTGRLLHFAFQRTASRLIEMRSSQYLTRPHRPRN